MAVGTLLGIAAGARALGGIAAGGQTIAQSRQMFTKEDRERLEAEVARRVDRVVEVEPGGPVPVEALARLGRRLDDRAVVGAEQDRHVRRAVVGMAPRRELDVDVEDVARVPHLTDEAREQGYQRFLKVDVPRAFAIAPSGAWSWRRGPDAASTALRNCQRRARTACRLYAVDDRVVW